MGHYCLNGTEYATQYKCPPGTYNNKTGQNDAGACSLCPASFYCEGYGRILPNDLCDAGFFCRRGADSPRPGDIGVLQASNALTPGETCYKAHDCVCPAQNTTRGM